MERKGHSQSINCNSQTVHQGQSNRGWAPSSLELQIETLPRRPWPALGPAGVGFVLPSGGHRREDHSWFQDLLQGSGGTDGQGGCCEGMLEFAEVLCRVKGEVMTLGSSNPYSF